MSDFYAFATAHPWLALGLTLIAGWTISSAAHGIGQFRIVERREQNQPEPDRKAEP